MTQSWGAMPEVGRNRSAKPGKPSIAGLHGKATGAACVAIVAVIALQAYVLILKLVQAPPAWAWYADPAYQYLLNGAALVSGDTPYLLYHPGMSLIWLVGLIEFVVHLVSPSAESVLLDSVQQPEHHIAIQQGILGFAYLVGLGFLAWRTLRSFGPLPALVLQLLIPNGDFCSFQSCSTGSRVCTSTNANGVSISSWIGCVLRNRSNREGALSPHVSVAPLPTEAEATSHLVRYHSGMCGPDPFSIAQ